MQVIVNLSGVVIVILNSVDACCLYTLDDCKLFPACSGFVVVYWCGRNIECCCKEVFKHSVGCTCRRNGVERCYLLNAGTTPESHKLDFLYGRRNCYCFDSLTVIECHSSDCFKTFCQSYGLKALAAVERTSGKSLDASRQTYLCQSLATPERRTYLFNSVGYGDGGEFCAVCKCLVAQLFQCRRQCRSCQSFETIERATDFCHTFWYYNLCRFSSVDVYLTPVSFWCGKHIV